ncbi:Conserved_hypothetical protein [Hexamita inflata]|uniref:Uncharacterized protein n=1 Tax=Hexamita inflata TaxID=28002 RepID=A0AA86NAJ0_9EUKA|nr:Conserved hypothetical protein [Hexamita inflata]
MKISQSVEFMTLKHMHKRELQKKDDEIDKYIGLYGSAIKKINYLEMQIEKLEHDISLIETKEVQRHKDRSLLLQAVDDKIFQQTVLEKKNIGYSRKAQMLWTIRRILSPSLFRFDQLQLGAPSERAVQTWKQNFKEEMGFVDNLINKTYSDVGPLADLYRKQRKIPEDEVQYGSILYDAICFITKTIVMEDGYKKNVIEVIDKNGERQDLPIKYAFAYIWSNHKREYGSQVMFVEWHHDGHSRKKQQEIAQMIVKDLAKKKMVVDTIGFDCDPGNSEIILKSFKKITDWYHEEGRHNVFEIYKDGSQFPALPAGAHLLKRPRGKLVGLPLSVSYQLDQQYIDKRELYKILPHCSATVFSEAPILRLRDDLCLHLFSQETIKALFRQPRTATNIKTIIFFLMNYHLELG